jgi:uncharacterized OB-fold protein
MAASFPLATAETLPFWEGCAAGELRYQCCENCGTVQLIPRSICATCHSSGLLWKRSSRRGTVLSHTTVRRAPTPAFRARVPYVIALVLMDEGFRQMVNVKGTAEVAIGQVVNIGFSEVDGVMLPEAEPAQ